MDEQLRIDLEARDGASANIDKVMAAFDRLKARYEAAAASFEQAAGFEAPAKAIEQAMDRAAGAMATGMAAFGATAEADFARVVNGARQVERQLEAQAQRQEAMYEAIDKRRTATIHAQMQQHVEAYLAGDRLIAESAEQAARQQVLAGRRAEQQLEDFDTKLAQHAQRQAQAESRSREETFFFVQATNQKMAADDEKRAQAKIQAAERAAQAERKYREDLFFYVQEQNQKLVADDERRAAAAARAASAGGAGGGGGIGGIIGAVGGMGGGPLGWAAGAAGAAGNVLGMLGGAASGGLNLLLAPIRGIGEAFGGMVSSIADAGKEMLNLIATAAGLYGVYQIAMQVQQAFSSLKQGVLDFQDVMVRVGSLTGATTNEMADMSAAILQVSMATGRSATELGEAMYFIESHGVKGADALNLLSNSGKLAAAGLGETNQIVRVVAGQMLAYNEVLDGTARSQERTTHYFDVFARTVQISAVPATEVANTFARITPLAAALHIGIDELGADFATISQTGLNASRVMTDLIAVFNNFLKGGKQQQEALQGIGLSIDTVRKTLGEHGLIAAAEQIWQAADRDINAVSQVFGDRTRALVGYLALVEDGGARADENLRKMQDSAGKTAAVFEAALTRVSVQWQRFTNIFQAFAIAAGANILPGIASDLNRINDALQRADFSAAGDAIIEAFQHVGQTVMSVLDSLGKSMFGAGMTMMETLASGIIQGINTVLNAAVNAVADFIAGFLLGHSWPPRGPLAGGDAGIMRWNQAAATAMLTHGQLMANAASNVAGVVNEQLSKIGGGGLNKAGLELAIANIDQQLLPWKLAADQIKNTYEAQLHPLERQITSLQRIKDLEYERQQLGFEQRDLELRMMHIRAEGDPRKRAELAGQLARLQEQREQHSIESRIATLNREAGQLRPGRGTSAQEIALRRREIGDELAILRVQQQQHRLVNVQLLGQYETKKAQLDVDKEGAKIQHDQFDLAQKQRLQPLLEQRDQLKDKMQSELDVIAAQTDGLEDQRKILQAQLQMVNAITGANKAGAGGGAGPWRMPETTLGEDLGAGISKSMQKNIGDLANEFSGRLSRSVSDYFTTNGPRVGAGLVGSIVGGMVGGLPGAIGGAFFGVRLLDALEERGVTGADLQRFADRFMGSLKDAFTRVQTRLSAHDFLGAVNEIMVTARSWIAEFQTSFFREWSVSRVTDEAGGMPMVTTQRYTGLGRTIIEAMFGQQDRELNFSIAYEMVTENVVKPAWDAIQKAWADFTAPTDLQTNAMGGRDMWFGAGRGPSQAEQMGRGILNAIQGAFKWVGTNLSGPIEVAGNALGKILEGAMAFISTDEQARATMGQAFETLGNDLAAPFLKGLGKGIVKGIWAVLSAPIGGGGGPAPVRAGGPFTPAISSAGPGAAPIMGPDAPGLIQRAVDLIPAGIDAVKGFIAGLTGSEANTNVNEGARTFGETVLGAVRLALDMHSPSEAMAEIGRGAVEGFNEGIADASSLTGPVVRMWLRSDVIAQAQQILIAGEGKGGGLRGVAGDALDAFSDAFASPPAGLASNMRAIGVVVTEAIMDPIEDPRTGIIARMRRAIDAMPKPRAPAPTPAGEGGGGGDRNIMAATGADFTVGGSGGTDSEHISLWASPGERVQVGAAAGGGSRQVNNHFNITVNGGDPDAVRQAIADGIAQGQGDQDGGNEFINAWRMAKQQGANRPIGFPTRRTRG